ncbi:MAG: hypothetical protein PF637_11390 [Spirochaetes bacterium]|jgi:hypothetical protein|nr:hypothetical protein [Spirochaetota bacterium]
MFRNNMVIVVIIHLLFVAGCDVPEGRQQMVFGKSDKVFTERLERFCNPKGVIPCRFSAEVEGDVVCRDSKDYHSYFVFDAHRALFLLSDNPLYFIELPSEVIYFQLLSEFSQLIKGRQPEIKNPNSVPREYVVGDNRFMIAFVPNEVRYSGRGGSLIDINYSENNEPASLIESAGSLIMYVPDFKEEKIYTELRDRMLNKSLSLLQYTGSESFDPHFDNSYITYYIEPFLPFDFSIFIGENLESETDEKEDDFALFCTVPLGNSQNGDDSFLAKTSSGRHGFIITIRGCLETVKEFFGKEGLPLKENRELPLSLILKDSYQDYMTLITSRDNEIEIHISIDNGRYTRVKPDIINDREMRLNEIERGRVYSLRGVSVEDGVTILAESKIYFPQIIFTEISFWGSSYRNQNGANNDDWVEILNISDTDVRLEDYDFYLTNTALTVKHWFGPSNEGSSSYDPLDLVLRPGERAVVALLTSESRNVSGDFLFGANAFGHRENIYKRGTVSQNAIGKGYRLSVFRGEKLITEAQTGDDSGSKLPFATMVRLSDGSWSTSDNDSGFPDTDINERRNYCSPGFAAAGEM